jgi:hypothetical protein
VKEEEEEEEASENVKLHKAKGSIYIPFDRQIVLYIVKVK